MSGFTTAAACLIGLSQLKNAFGFSTPVPQQGDANTEWNYQVMQWYSRNWYGTYNNTAKDGNHTFQNPIAVKIFFGLYIPLLVIQRLKGIIKATPEQKKTLWFKAWTLFANLSSFIGIIICGKVAYDAISANYSKGKITDYYASKLSIVGPINPGVNIIRVPSFKYPWGTLFVDILPLTFITFMESYSIAAKIATTNKQLHLLSCSQELWAVGLANMIGSVGSAYPVAGSYSRSSLNSTAGGKTPLSNAVTVCAMLLCLGVATEALFFIPNAALAAVIWVALYNIIAFTEWWEAWVSSFKDFCVMIITFFITFVLDTSVGLAVGLGASLIVYLFENLLSKRNFPVSRQVGKARQVIELIRLNNDLNFLTIPRIKDFISFDILMREIPPHAIIIDFVDVKHIDLTSLKAFSEIKSQCHELNIIFAVTNLIEEVEKDLIKFDILGDVDRADLYPPESVISEGAGEDDVDETDDAPVSFDILKKEGFKELTENPNKAVQLLQAHPALATYIVEYDI